MWFLIHRRYISLGSDQIIIMVRRIAHSSALFSFFAMGCLLSTSNGFAELSKSPSGIQNSLSTKNTHSLVSKNTADNNPEKIFTGNNISGNRRKLFHCATNTVAAAISALAILPQAASSEPSSSTLLVPTPSFSRETYWPLGKIAFSLLPLAGGQRRATVKQCVVPETMWTYDQIQGILNVNVPVRQTVIRLSEECGGGLWVHNPVAPTPELLKYMKDLETEYGPIRHIVLGTVALEHKATFGAFARNFPHATVWIQPGQWSFPVQFPLEYLGVSQRRPFGTLRELPPQTSVNAPEWAKDIHYEMLGPLKFKSVGAFSETAFYHRPSKSLLVTDIVCQVTEEPPAIIQEDPRALLYHSRDSSSDLSLLEKGDTPELRRKGWRRMVQFGLIFLPSQIEVLSLSEDLKDARHLPKELRNLGQGAVPLQLYPWRWKSEKDDLNNFQVLTNGGRLFCPPILTKLILDREPERTLAWVGRVCNRFEGMERVVPCHLNNDIKATSKDFYDAFDSLRCSSNGRRKAGPLKSDLELLQNASDILTKYAIVSESEVGCS